MVLSGHPGTSDDDEDGGIAASAIIEDEDVEVIVPQETVTAEELVHENDVALMNMMAPDGY